MKKAFSVFLVLCVIIITTACGNDNNRIPNVISSAASVSINGEKSDTVEAAMGAFEGSQGDYIEFFFDEEVTFNTFFISEKTTSVRQYNNYALTGDRYRLIHTGKHITSENIALDTVTTTAIKVVILNTEIGNDSFVIQGISAYEVKNTTE